MRKPKSNGSCELESGRIQRGTALSPLIALLALPDDRLASELKRAFEDVACDWRLVRVTDGSAAARYVMENRLPDLLVTSADLAGISGSDLIDWARSFNCQHPFGVMVYGEPKTAEGREELLRQDVKIILNCDSPRSLLHEKLSHLVSQIEKRRYARI